MKGSPLAIISCIVLGACAAPTRKIAFAGSGIVREVGSASEITTGPGEYEGYRVLACPRELGVRGVVGAGERLVPHEYPLNFEVQQRLEAAVGSTTIGVSYGKSCVEGQSSFDVWVRRYRDVDEAIRKTGLFVRENHLAIHCTIRLASEAMLHREDWRPKAMSRDVGTMADIGTRPGTYEGYLVRACSQYGLFGIDGQGHNPLPRENAALSALHNRLEKFLKPLALGVGYGLGCRKGEVGFRIYVSHLREVDAVITRAGEFLRERDLAATITVHLASESKDL